MTIDVAQADELLTTTRAVRKRLDLERPVPREVIIECIDVALQAPTGSNAQGWRWMVVTDQAKKDTIAEYYRQAGAAYLRSGKDGLDALPEGRRGEMGKVIDSALYLAENLEKVPVFVIPCILGRLPEGGGGMGAGFWGSIFPAVWSFQLALRARGLGTCITSFHLAFEKQVAELLDIPYDTVSQSCLLPVAYTKGDRFKPAVRRPASEITYWEAWKS